MTRSRGSSLSGEAPPCPAELPHLPPTRNLAFYATLVLAVGPLWSIPPLSWTFVLYSLISGSVWSYSGLVLLTFIWAIAEVFFSVHYFLLARFVSGPCPIPAGEMRELQITFTRVLKAGLADLPEEGFDEESTKAARPGSPAEEIVQLGRDDRRAVDFRNSLRTWFGKVPWSRIRRREMQEWLYWAIFNARLPTNISSLPHAQQVFLNEALQLIEKRSGTEIPPGTNARARPMLLTLDPVNFAWRPLIWYLVIAAGNCGMKHRLMMKHGMRIIEHDGVEYLLRVPKGWNMGTDTTPLVFLHGLGLGLVQYTLVLHTLLPRSAHRPVLVPLQPHISQLIFHPKFLTPKGRHDMTTSMAALFVKLGWVSDEQEGEKSVATSKGVTVLSHSNGSFVHAWLLKGHPSMITRSCFVDPVTFCSWEGDVCHNFLYRRPATALQLLMYYFVGSELGVTNVLQRHFDWASNSLYYEEIPHARDPSRAKFFLGGQDAILSADRVKKYLTSHGISKGLMYDPNGKHGSALLQGTAGFMELERWLDEPDPQ
ncbi:unnamed protein product [Peniophora sp. CBMAI 1063]|nr:unnamed protein product [Peniophora sp. CBMAI 1063]